ncbi:MAG: SDR family oxidoreductase [Pseudomonadota bacterium]
MGRFDGKRVLITGGTSGIGLATARRIADEGGQVMVTGTRAERIAAAQGMLPSGYALANDAGDPGAAKALAHAAQEHLGGIDALFLNAGYGARPDQDTPEEFDRINQVNVRGPVLQMKALDPLVSFGGSILLTASVAPHIGTTLEIYAVTKAACAVFARSWARKYAPRGIRVNAVSPGPIETDFFDRMGEGVKDAATERMRGAVPLDRFGTADEVAAVACFLLSDEASYVTGSEYMVDGGLTLR